MRGAPMPRDHYMYHQQYLRAQDMIGQTARSPYAQRYGRTNRIQSTHNWLTIRFSSTRFVRRSHAAGAGDPKDLSADADERPATSPPIELRRIVAAPNAAAPPPTQQLPANNNNVSGGVVVVAPNSNSSSNNVVMRSAAGANAVPHSLQSPQDQRATGKQSECFCRNQSRLRILY